ncbi:uncharacterized protein LOC105847709 [Hydra vulgaris]|uniref:uncharacterized protein LOC105847709 n=1 Tax=Hydra vulgaris TaxID=6087 RepID=UPI001F5F93A3|nr:uncharacterized protein LOC105847709 [Hydra vulgaris]
MAKGDRHWTVAQRNLAVDLVKQSKTYREVEAETGISNCTVSRIMSARNLAKKVENEHGIKITSQTIRNGIKEAGFQRRHVCKKLYLTKNHIKRQFDFAKIYRNMDISFWKEILWSDESKFNLKSSDGAKKVWRKKGEVYKLNCMKGTVKFGDGNIIVCGPMVWKGVEKLAFIDSKMDAPLYREILKNNLKSSARKLRLGNS